MLEDVIFQPDMLQDDISSQLSAQIFEFCDHDLFNETLQNSEEVTSCSNCCYEENSSTITTLTYPLTQQHQQDPQNFTHHHHHHYTNQSNNATSSSTAPKTASPDEAATAAIVFDANDDIIDGDISASIDFSVPPHFDFGAVNQAAVSAAAAAALFDDDCLSSVVVPPSFPFAGPAMGNYLPAPDSLFAGAGSGLMMPPDLHPQEMVEYAQADPTIFCHDSMPRVFNHSADLQGLGSESSQQLISGAGNSASLATDIPNMGDQTFKVGKLSVEQRKEKIHRYMKKRNERNFSKKIKYACRKTLADSRPRVRGRFAKNDDFGETPRANSSNHEEEDDEEVVVKEEDEMVDSSDIFAHISGVNSFKCNYPIQSWI